MAPDRNPQDTTPSVPEFAVLSTRFRARDPTPRKFCKFGNFGDSGNPRKLAKRWEGGTWEAGPRRQNAGLAKLLVPESAPGGC